MQETSRLTCSTSFSIDVMSVYESRHEYFNITQIETINVFTSKNFNNQFWFSKHDYLINHKKELFKIN